MRLGMVKSPRLTPGVPNHVDIEEHAPEFQRGLKFGSHELWLHEDFAAIEGQVSSPPTTPPYDRQVSFSSARVQFFATRRLTSGGPQRRSGFMQLIFACFPRIQTHMPFVVPLSEAGAFESASECDTSEHTAGRLLRQFQNCVLFANTDRSDHETLRRRASGHTQTFRRQQRLVSL